jgi:hypothetical protein
MSSKPLPVYFTSEERKLLARITLEAKRSESEMVRWLVEEFALGRLVSAEQIEAQRLDASVRKMWKEMHDMMENITRLSARITRTPVDGEASTVRIEEPPMEGGRHHVTEIREDESVSEKSPAQSKKAK